MVLMADTISSRRAGCTDGDAACHCGFDRWWVGEALECGDYGHDVLGLHGVEAGNLRDVPSPLELREPLERAEQQRSVPDRHDDVLWHTIAGLVEYFVGEQLCSLDEVGAEDVGGVYQTVLGRVLDGGGGRPPLAVRGWSAPARRRRRSAGAWPVGADDGAKMWAFMPARAA